MFAASIFASSLDPVHGAALEDELGRSEVRVRASTTPLVPGVTVQGYGLPARLERLGYERVRARPAEPGTFFWGHEIFWIHRRAHRTGGDEHPATLIGLELRRSDGRILGLVDGERTPIEDAWLEGETLAESLDEDRAPRLPIALDDLPEHVWRPVLAAEDSRFFDHGGVDARGVARALIANLKAGGVAQGGSTITQQLIKNRDLTPKRTVGRKLSEAVRALFLEAQYDKREILEAYLNHVYLGHVDGRAIHGFGAAARVYFGKSATRLDLAESALLAGMIQAPNRLTPTRHPERAKTRRDWVLDRLAALEWLDAARIERARARTVRVDPKAIAPSLAGDFLDRVAILARRAAPQRADEGRGMVVETTLDTALQIHAEATVDSTLERLRRRHGRDVQAALVALEASSGDVLAWVGGGPVAGKPDRRRGGFDRVSSARRQPGSAIKPFVLLEAFGPCGDQDPLHPARRVADRRLAIDLPSGPWRPTNDDGRFTGAVTLRQALEQSRNVPFVRIARHCGFEATADRLRAAGLDVPEPAPPAFSLGATEVTPLDLAVAYTTFPNLGRRVAPRLYRRIERPSGRGLASLRIDHKRVTGAATAFLVHDVLAGTAERGTARGTGIEGVTVHAKTGTSSDRRDAWLAGYANGIVTVVWLGRDEGRPLGLSGSRAAAPLWQAFMSTAVALRPPVPDPEPPGEVLYRFIDPESGLRVRAGRRGAVREVFRRRALPPRKRIFKPNHPVAILE